MPDIAKEQADLEKAERDIEEGEARVSHQEALVEELRRDGHDTGDAEKLLWTLRQSLDVWRAHRDVIKAVLATSRQRGSGA